MKRLRGNFHMLHCTSWTERLTKQCIRGIVLRRAGAVWSQSSARDTGCYRGRDTRHPPQHTMRHPPPLKTEGGNGGESQFIIHTYACYCVTVSSCSTPKFYSLKFCLKRECYHQTRSHSLWGYFQSHLRFYYRFVAVKDSAREGVLAKCDRNNRHQQLLRIVHNKRAYMFIMFSLNDLISKLVNY